MSQVVCVGYGVSANVFAFAIISVRMQQFVFGAVGGFARDTTTLNRHLVACSRTAKNINARHQFVPGYRGSRHVKTQGCSRSSRLRKEGFYVLGAIICPNGKDTSRCCRDNRVVTLTLVCPLSGVFHRLVLLSSLAKPDLTAAVKFKVRRTAGHLSCSLRRVSNWAMLFHMFAASRARYRACEMHVPVHSM